MAELQEGLFSFCHPAILPSCHPAIPARIEVRRVPQRGSDDPRVIEAILDDGFLCHVGFVVDVSRT